MPTVARLSRAAIRVYADDHPPPHFHLIGPGSDATVRLGTLEVLRGHADRRDVAEAMTWCAAHPGVLEAEWRRLNERD
jgi:hypothetical protein